MAENEHPPTGPPGSPGPPPGEEPTPPTGELIIPPPAQPSPPPAAQPPAPREPAGVDPEQVRQFQEFQQFQQFQELIRQQKERGFPQGQPPPPGFLQPWGQPPPKRPGPLKRALRAVLGKVATAIIASLLLIGAGYLAIDYFFGGAPSQPPAHEIGGRQQEGTVVFEEDPRTAVQRVYDDVAQGDPENACGRFTDEARDQFTSHFGSYGADCEEIVRALNAEVTPGQKSEYANPAEMSSVPNTSTTDSVTVSSCTLGVRGGPLLGRLTVTRDRDSAGGGNQWIVSEHERETCTEVPSGPPTS